MPRDSSLTIEVVQGDITVERVDAIVNAANSSLRGGGGVDGAIHGAAGPQLLEACIALRGCATGQAKITPGFDLPTQWVIHTVGPIWSGGTSDEDALLASCYTSSLACAVEVAARSVAFPAISTGVYRFPIERAARIAVASVQTAPDSIELVRFVCFDQANVEAYERAIADLV